MNDERIHDEIDGWLDLGKWEEANDLWEALPGPLKINKRGAKQCYRINQLGKNWSVATEMAKWLIQLDPKSPRWPLEHAYCLAEAGMVPQAIEVAEKGLETFPEEAIYSYNIACYLVRLERISDAKVHLEKAFKLDPKLRLAALEDPDLGPVW